MCWRHAINARVQGAKYHNAALTLAYHLGELLDVPARALADCVRK